MVTKEKKIVKKDIILNALYFSSLATKREWATADDGEKIPITIIYYKGFKKKKNDDAKLFITTYGAYGSRSRAGFDRNIIPLLDRNFVYAIAHVRGGNDMGMDWYDNGKLLNKKNSFTDFIACTEHLISKSYTNKDRVVAYGGSAGGLVMGAIANMRPDLYKLILLDAPFVDALNTMLDDKSPSTTLEYKEWGNPADKTYFDYIKSYSPYDNIKPQQYPNMLFSIGLNDTRVGYWEAAKAVAKIRLNQTSNSKILLRTDIYSGHFGPSGRFARYRDLAYKYALIFDIMGN